MREHRVQTGLLVVPCIIGSSGGLLLRNLIVDQSVANITAFTDPFAEADEDTGETKQSQNYIHIRIQRKFTFDSSFPVNAKPGATD